MSVQSERGEASAENKCGDRMRRASAGSKCGELARRVSAKMVEKGRGNEDG